MRLRHAVPTALALFALAAPATVLADEEVGTTDGGGYISVDRVDLPAQSRIKEGRRRTGRAVLRCRSDQCSYWLGPRAGTALAFTGDFNPFRVWQVDLVKGQTVTRPYMFEALKDNRREGPETFSFVVRSDVRTGGGPWYTAESKTVVTILDVPPPVSPATRVQSDPVCFSC